MAAISLKLTLIAVVCMIFAAHYASEATLSCGTVNKALVPCLLYLQGKKLLAGGCCSSVSSLNRLAATTPDRQQACRCLKTAAAAISGIDYRLAAGLPGKCGVNIPYKISPSTNCATVR